MHSNASARTIYLHIFVNKKVEAIEIEVADTRFQSVLHGKEAIKHDVLHAILQRNIHYSGLLCQDFTVQMVFGRPSVKRFALCYQTVVRLSVLSVCLSYLSVTLAYCGQTVGRIKPGHTVLDGDPAPLPKGAQPPNFRPMSVVAKRLNG